MEPNGLEPHARKAPREAQLHREVLQLSALIAIAVVAFILTRALAASNRETTLQDAEAWYVRGQAQLAHGHLEQAVESFRRAAVRNRYERRYALALARALAHKGDTEVARATLLTLREAAPEDAEINLELARLAVRRQDVTEALRFYRSALYAPFSVESSDSRREIRFELIQFLLEHGQFGRAESELLALNGDLPEDPPTRIRAAQLFEQAGDARRALEQYERVLRTASDNPIALAGAGTSAFALGNFAAAARYLHRAPGTLDDVERKRRIADLILTKDPLAPRIGAAERRRRLTSGLEYAQRRLTACRPATSAVADEMRTLEKHAEALALQVIRPDALDQDAIESGVDLLNRVASHAARACGPATLWDEAIMLIARQHASETR